MKIALLGSAPSSVNLAPYHDKSWVDARQGIPTSPFQLEPWVDSTWEIWGVSPGAFAFAQRANRWFEVHRWEPGQPWFQPAYIQFLRDFKGPVYTGGTIPEIKNHVIYPIERVEAEFSAYFLHSSLSLMVAMAILEIEDSRKLPRVGDQVRLKKANQKGNKGAERTMYIVSQSPLGSVSCAWMDGKRKPCADWFDPATLDIVTRAEEPHERDTIGLWGVDMAANEEYGDQRSGCQFFLLEALRRGIEIYVPPESCLLRPKPIYGLSEWHHDYIKCTSKMREYNQRQQHFSAMRQEAEVNLQHLAGAQGDMTYFINTWTNPYGIPAGVKIHIEKGTGLGGGTTMPRPQTEFIEHPPGGGLYGGAAGGDMLELIGGENSYAGGDEKKPAKTPPKRVRKPAPKAKPKKAARRR